MEPKILKTENDHKTAIAEVERLLDLQPSTGSPEAEKLNLLSLLVENYEKDTFPISKPDPIEALKFRMEQKGLTNRDLVPYIGSPSKVSEVLSKKRPLTLAMIRALHQGLAIPAEVLLQGSDNSLPENVDLDWSRFPLKEMIKRGWIKANIQGVYDHAEEVVRSFFAPLEQVKYLSLLCRRTIHERSGREMDKYALFAWAARIQIRALGFEPLPKYAEGVVNSDFMKEIARFSWSDRGPVIATEFLQKHGICVIVEPQLPGTYIDGASMLGKNGRPIIALSIRYDRLDNFWFTLLHELVHIHSHLSTAEPIFVDDLDVQEVKDSKEIEADDQAGNILIPRSRWKNSRAFQQRTVEAIQELAKELKIHPAIIAGRLRHESRNFHIFNQLIGRGQVRKLFEGNPLP
jgi:HTH-type transcriptional regulator/antitoxin HigA